MTQAPAGQEQEAGPDSPRPPISRRPRRLRWWALAVAGVLLAASLAYGFPWCASVYQVERAGHILGAGAPSDALYQTAQDALSRALHWNPANAQAYRLLAQLHAQRLDWVDAADAWAHFSALRSTDPQGHWSLAVVCELVASSDLGQVSGQPCGTDEQSRRQRLVELWRSAGQSAAGFVRAGNALQEKKAWSDAIGFYNRALLVDDQSATAWKGLGQVYQTLGQSDVALQAYAQVVTLGLEPELTAAAHARRGEILAAEQRWPEASNELAQAVRLIPDRGVYHLDYGWYLYRSGGDKATVRSELVQAARLSPANPWPRLHLAELAFASGDLVTTLEEASAAAELDPALFWGWLWQGKALASLGRPAEAEVSLRRAVEVAPGKAAAHAELGSFLKQNLRLEEAVSQYEEAVRLAPTDIGYRLGLAGVFRAQGWIDQAVSVYRQVLDLDPSNAPAKQALLDLGY